MWIEGLNATVVRRPALAAATLFILGISLHQVLPRQPLLWLIVIALSIAAAAALVRRPACSLLLAVAIVLAGTCSAQLAHFFYPRDHIGTFLGDEPRLGWVEGRIEESPRIIESPPRGRKLPERQLFTLDLRQVRTWDGWTWASGEVPVSVSPPQPELAAGQVVRVLGRLERPPPAMNAGAPDPAEQDRRRRVLVTMHVSRSYDVQLVSGAHRPFLPLSGIRTDARRLLDAGFGQDQTVDRSLLRALVFGDREPTLREVEDDFNHTGTAHLLAANGARIAILAAFLYLICRLLRLPPQWTLAVVTALVAGFGLLTMPAAQAIRPVLVCIAVGFGLIGRRLADSIQLLAIAAVAILVLKPLDLYGAGFQLSFVIVLGLILFTRPVLTFLRRFEDPHKRVAKPFLPQSALQRWRDRAGRWMVEAAAAGLVAWVVALPLVAYHFEQFNAWTVPFSLLLSPLAMAALAAGLAKIALTAICPPLTPAWAMLAWIPATSLRHVVAWLVHVPGADLPIAQPPLPEILLFYCLLAVPMISWPRQRLRACARCVPAGACAMLALPLLLGFVGQSTPRGGVRITLLSVGAGQCAVVEPAGGGIVLLDAGSSSFSDPLRTCIGPFLRHEGRWSIDSIWLSHGDYDHISAVRQLVPEYGAREVLTSPHFRRHAHESKPCESLLALLDRSRHPPRLIIAGDRISLGNGIDVQVLWPLADCPFNSNNTGLVLRLTCCGRSILFPADIQEPAERELLRHPERLRSDVLVAPHHGSAEPTTDEFVRAVDPKVILSSNGERLTMKQRLFETEVGGRPLYRTNRCGAITVTIDRDGKIDVIPYLRGKAPALTVARE